WLASARVRAAARAWRDASGHQHSSTDDHGNLRPGQLRPERRPLSPEVLSPCVRLPPVGGRLYDARAVALGELRCRVAHARTLARSDHQDHARILAGAREAVLGPRWSMEEVPGLQPALLVLDEQRAFSGEDEEVFLVLLGVVEHGL